MADVSTMTAMALAAREATSLRAKTEPELLQVVRPTVATAQGDANARALAKREELVLGEHRHAGDPGKDVEVEDDAAQHNLGRADVIIHSIVGRGAGRVVTVANGVGKDLKCGADMSEQDRSEGVENVVLSPASAFPIASAGTNQVVPCRSGSISGSEARRICEVITISDGETEFEQTAADDADDSPSDHDTDSVVITGENDLNDNVAAVCTEKVTPRAQSRRRGQLAREDEVPTKVVDATDEASKEEGTLHRLNRTYGLVHLVHPQDHTSWLACRLCAHFDGKGKKGRVQVYEPPWNEGRMKNHAALHSQWRRLARDGNELFAVGDKKADMEKCEAAMRRMRKVRKREAKVRRILERKRLREVEVGEEELASLGYDGSGEDGKGPSSRKEGTGEAVSKRRRVEVGGEEEEAVRIRQAERGVGGVNGVDGCVVNAVKVESEDVDEPAVRMLRAEDGNQTEIGTRLEEVNDSEETEQNVSQPSRIEGNDEEGVNRVQAKFPLVGASHDAGGGVKWLGCRFCAQFGRKMTKKAKKSGYIRMFDAPFIEFRIERHAKVEHKKLWSRFEKEAWGMFGRRSGQMEAYAKQVEAWEALRREENERSNSGQR